VILCVIGEVLQAQYIFEYVGYISFLFGLSIASGFLQYRIKNYLIIKNIHKSII